MNIDAFAQMINDGVRPVVEFTAGVKNFEWCIEPQMRATVTSVRFDARIEMWCVELDLEGFQDYNEDFMSHQYYDANGTPCLSAKEAGQWPKTETLFVYWRDSAVEDYFTTVSDNGVYKLYLEEETTLTYVQWMEQRLALYLK